MTVHIRYRPGNGSPFDLLRWRCTGTGYGCGVWMASAWHWAPAMVAEHVARCHPGETVRGLSGQAPGPRSGLVDLMGVEL